MAEAISVARPYAVAAFDAASKAGELKNWSDMLGAAASVAADERVRELITSPRIERQQLEGLMFAACGDKAGDKVRNFIKLLVENQRLIVLPEIAAMFEAMRAEAEKSVEVEVTSAFDLTEAQKQKIAAAMKTRLRRDIRLTCKTDGALLGGIVVRAGDKVIDGSARAHLAALATALA